MEQWVVMKIGGNQYERHNLPGVCLGVFDSIEALPAPERYDYDAKVGGPDWYEWWAYEITGSGRTLSYEHASLYKTAEWQKNAWCEDGDLERIVRDDTNANHQAE